MAVEIMLSLQLFFDQAKPSYKKINRRHPISQGSVVPGVLTRPVRELGMDPWLGMAGPTNAIRGAVCCEPFR